MQVIINSSVIADGVTEIESSEYILRGYGDVDKKLANVGAKIKVTE